MENKFNHSEEKHFIHVAATTKASAVWHERTSTTNKQQEDTTETDSERFYTPDEFELIPPNLIIRSSAPKSPTDNEGRCIPNGHALAGNYQELVQDIQLHLSEHRRCPLQSDVPEYWQEEPKSYRIGFVELFRQRMHYDRLGIPLTSLELLYMGDSEREWLRQHRRREREYRQQQQHQQQQGQGQEQHRYRERRCRNSGTQTDSKMLGRRAHRLHGGNGCICGFIEVEPGKSMLNSELRETRGLGMPGNMNEHLLTVSSQYFEAVSCQPIGADERMRNIYLTRAEPPGYVCCGCQAMRLHKRHRKPQPAAAGAPARPTSVRILLPPSPLPPLRSTHLEHRKSRELRRWRKRRDEESKMQSSQRGTYQFPVKYKNKPKEQVKQRAQCVDLKDKAELSYLLRRSPKNLHLPMQMGAEPSVEDESYDERASNESSKVEVLLAPDTPRLVLNETEMSGMMQSKSITLTESSSQVDSMLGIANAARLSFEAGDLRHGSTDTLNEVWCDPGIFLAARTPPVPQSLRERRKQLTVDALTVGYLGAPVLGEQAARAALEKCAYLSREFDSLSREQRTKDIALRLQQLRHFQEKASWDYVCCIHANESRDGHRHSYNQTIPRLFDCPLNKPNCVRLLNESMLAHFLHVHFSEPGLALNELFERDQVLIMFKPRSFKRAHNVCLSMIVYAGAKDKSNALPITHYMPDYNVGLPGRYSKFTGHMPIFVMACRTRRRFRERSTEKQSLGCDSSSSSLSLPDRQCVGESVMALWLVSVELTRPIHVQMTVFNRRVDISRSSIMQVRGLNKCHDCDKFMAKSKNYLRLTSQDLRVLTNNYTEPVYMEISVQDYAHPAALERLMKLRRSYMP
ncbi:PREDICTED: uncharacterized protein LOC108620251 [Drosophila arizonae]|uniref:Uncharacterized protein LOC108620251 n=1 Tax=Drosophila arizonae TaxID=7263 RepID=A0ABM1PZL3_DROAR|nr:PREDICTED: uncharacterized protein LOC108620251 [Drosophila arizonae]